MRIKFELHWSPDNWEGPVNVKISQYDIPTMVDWYCGDTHLHTNYTDNAVEFGAPIYATRAANNAMGLDWMIVTDHSFDLWQEKWNVSTADCNNHSDNLFRVMQGEEVSCYLPGTDTIPGAYQYNHLLVYGADFIPGGEWEDGTGSDYTPAEAIAIANSQGGVTYPAHPFYDDAFRDPWQNYSLNFTGLQIWNYASDKTSHLPNGLAKWSELLLGGRHVYVEGGTDAHGDFNTHAGKVKTYVCIPGYSQNSLPPRSEILNALRNGHSVMTDGPLVIFDINGEMIGNNVSLTNGTNATLRIQWNSTQEFGYVNNITVKKGVINGTEETNFTIIQPSSIGKNTLCDEHELIISPNNSCYYRIEAYSNTTDGEQHRCYTNPIWVDVLANQLPTAFFTYSPENPIVNQTITLNASGSYDPDGGDMTNYEWNFGDGNITNTTEAIITHSYSEAGDYMVNLTVEDDEGTLNTTSKTIIVHPQAIFDTEAPANPYPSIFGIHNGTIKPNQTILISKLYTYPCAGTGGHTNYARIWNNSCLDVNASWEGYVGDWHNISFSESFTLVANETYNYTIKTGSYPQIHHTPELPTANGWINCAEFTDVNGRVYYDRIPAIRLYF